MNKAQPKVLTDVPEDIGQARLTYAWEWFKYHAGQRVSMFNYFLIITGILANAYVSLLKDAKPLIKQGSWALGAIGALVAIGFVVLDIRNKSLVDRASKLLAGLETNSVFGEREPKLASLPDDPGDRTAWTRFIELLKSRTRLIKLLGSHSLWIRLIEGVVAGIFLFVAIFAHNVAALVGG